jgi:hypothetical protein
MIFQKLDEVDREKTFSHATFSVNDDVDLFWHSRVFVKGSLNLQFAAHACGVSMARLIGCPDLLDVLEWNPTGLGLAAALGQQEHWTFCAALSNCCCAVSAKVVVQ